MKNNWQKIWDGKKNKLDEIDLNDERQLVVELKRLAGWDFFGKSDGVSFDFCKENYEYIRANLNLHEGGGSVFEVGCGSGAELYFFHKDGFKIGGMDYAPNLLDVAKKVIGEKNFVECICNEALSLSTDIKYDAVFSGGAFVYFPDTKYAEKVLDRMVEKAKNCVATVRMLKEETKDEYLKYRREVIKNYDELYKDLPKLFLSKKFFIDYAAKNNLDVTFPEHHMEGFWNEPFNFDCFLYKK